jgi:Family of unknown function (DUF6790)
MQTAIVFALSNFTLSFLVLGFVLGLIAYARSERGPGALAEAMLAYYLLCALGFSFLYNFVMHVFFQSIAAGNIGWQPSPFETEVGFASLGFAAVALLAFKGSYGLRVGAVAGPSIFLLGAAGGHVYQMIAAHNFAPGNAGIIFWTDIVVPLIGFALLALQRRYSSGSVVK